MFCQKLTASFSDLQRCHNSATCSSPNLGNN